jgi:DNA-binding NarL/FixJ family response regulator
MAGSRSGVRDPISPLTAAPRQLAAHSDSDFAARQALPSGKGVVAEFVEGASRTLQQQQAMTPIRVLLVDDHALVRAALRSFIAGLRGIEVVSEAGDGREALEEVGRHRPNLVLMDISMPRLGGVEATRIICREHPGMKIIMLSMHMHEDYVIQSLRAGAAGYVHKGSPPRELELAIESVMRGQLFLSPAVSKPVIEAYLNQSTNGASALEQLTPRQREILQLIAEGHSSKQIAHILDASVKTIDAHRANIMERLGVRNVPGLVRYAIRFGLVSTED